MGNQYSNISVYNARRESLIQYLFESKRTALVSPDTNNFIVIYDKDFHLYELSFVIYLSRFLNCTVMVSYLYDGTEFGYKIYCQGILSDDYSTSDFQRENINNHKRSQTIANIFNCQSKVEQIYNVLNKKIGQETDIINYFNSYSEAGLDFLIQSELFPLEQLRHEALALLIGLDPCWSVGIDYNNIIYGDIECHCDEYNIDVNEAFSMLDPINTVLPY